MAASLLDAFNQQAFDIGMREEQAPADARWAQLTSAYKGANSVGAKTQRVRHFHEGH
jgi:hypothetical protein